MTTNTKTETAEQFIGPVLVRIMRETEDVLGRRLTDSEHSAFKAGFMGGYSEALGYANVQLKTLLEESQ